MSSAMLIDTIARPYAKAAFDVALAADAIDLWMQRLDKIALWVKTPSIAVLLDDPKVRPQSLYELFLTLLGETLNESEQRFIRLLIDYRRIALMPQIAQLFRQRIRAYRKQVKVCVTTAKTLTATQRRRLKEALHRRLQCEIELSSKLDKALIGGVVVRIGDTVIDGSLRGRLNRLRYELEENQL